MNTTTMKPNAVMSIQCGCMPRSVHRMTCILAGSLVFGGAVLSSSHVGFGLISLLGAAWLILSGIYGSGNK